MNDEDVGQEDGPSQEWLEEKAQQGVVFLMQSRGWGFEQARSVVLLGGVKLPAIPNTKIGKQAAKIADMLCDGYSGYEIARQLGFSPPGVRRFCHQQQLDLPQRHTVESVKEDVLHAVEEGKTCAQIAEEFGFDESSIAEWCKKNGVFLRDPHHQKVIVAKGKYILIYLPEHPYADGKGYVRLHRLIAEMKVGRYLKREEIVHHVDGNTFNEDPDNLEVTTKSEHAKTHNAQGDTGWSKYHSKH